MTTARSSWRSSGIAGILTLSLAAAAATPLCAHRLDELLQAARITIDPSSVQIELNLTPGVAIAAATLADLDRDADGQFSDSESRAYAARVAGALRLDVDGRPLALHLVERRFPTASAIARGEGAIRLSLAAELPRLEAGDHRVAFRNDHRPDAGVYLANAVMPSGARVSVLAQTRDVDQRSLVIDYRLLAGTPTRRHWVWLGGGAGALAIVARVIRRRRRAR